MNAVDGFEVHEGSPPHMAIAGREFDSDVELPRRVFQEPRWSSWKNQDWLD